MGIFRKRAIEPERGGVGLHLVSNEPPAICIDSFARAVDGGATGVPFAPIWTGSDGESGIAGQPELVLAKPEGDPWGGSGGYCSYYYLAAFASQGGGSELGLYRDPPGRNMQKAIDLTWQELDGWRKADSSLTDVGDLLAFPIKVPAPVLTDEYIESLLAPSGSAPTERNLLIARIQLAYLVLAQGIMWLERESVPQQGIDQLVGSYRFRAGATSLADLQAIFDALADRLSLNKAADLHSFLKMLSMQMFKNFDPEAVVRAGVIATETPDGHVVPTEISDPSPRLVFVKSDPVGGLGDLLPTDPRHQRTGNRSSRPPHAAWSGVTWL